jgi:tetratricopeptide (TPR) repeat protein
MMTLLRFRAMFSTRFLQLPLIGVLSFVIFATIGVALPALGQQNTTTAQVSEKDILKQLEDGANLYNKKEYANSLHTFSKVITQLKATQPIPEANKEWLSQALYYRGMTYIALGQIREGEQKREDAVTLYKKGEADYTESVTHNPKNAESFNHRGMARLRLDDPNGAMSDYFEAIKVKPDYANAFYNRGVLFFSLQDDAAAIKDYDNAIKIDPNYKDAWNNRGLVKLVLANEHAKKEEHSIAQQIFNEGCADLKKAGDLGLKLGHENVEKFCKDGYKGAR